MAISSNPSELANAARCYFNCIPTGMQKAVLVYVLAQAAGLGNLSPSQLANAARCYASCIPPGMLDEVIAYLLNQIANSNSDQPVDCVMLSGDGDPTGVETPDFEGQLYHDETNDVYYRSTGTTAADWTLITGEPCENLEGAGNPL